MDWATFVVALGTLALAGATFRLARHTRNLASTSAADLQAQWRPIVLPGASSPEQLTPDKIALAGGKLQVAIRNAGRGPALYVRTELDPGANAQHGAIAAMAVGDVRFLTFTGVSKEQQQLVQLLVDYRDLAGRPYSTSITLDLQNGVPYDVQPFERSVTHLGDAVYPQPGLRDVSPKRPQPLRARVREVLRVLSGKPLMGD